MLLIVYLEGIVLKSNNKIYSIKFQKLLKNVKNPYENGNAKKIAKVLRSVPLENILKKKFFNIKF